MFCTVEIKALLFNEKGIMKCIQSVGSCRVHRPLLSIHVCICCLSPMSVGAFSPFEVQIHKWTVSCVFTKTSLGCFASVFLLRTALDVKT